MHNIRKLLFLFLCGSAWATTSVTGHIQNLGTGNVTSGAFVRFWLRGCGGNQPTVTGIGIIGPSQGGVFYFDITANSVGLVTGTLYSTRDATGLLGGDISCGGSTTSVWYGMQIFQNGKGGPETAIHAKSGTTLDITSVTPITTNPVITAPSGDSTYARLDGGNQPFLGSVTPSGNGVLNLGSSSNRWNLFGNTLNLSGLATLSGAATIGTTLGVTGATTLSSLTVSGTSALGTTTVPTVASSDNSTNAASTAFVKAALGFSIFAKGTSAPFTIGGNSTTTASVPLSVTFPNTSYTAVCNISTPSGAAYGLVGAQPLDTSHVTTTSFNTTVGSITGVTVTCVAFE